MVKRDNNNSGWLPENSKNEIDDTLTLSLDCSIFVTSIKIKQSERNIS
ncbi:hypothetical protein PL9214720035 [Planktothrix tepida PCC 9214]|uniref:Uncharacterized protein n=1 Tax=Planktothrix tepida PCC 9214 TaxID=671072 RepID=A0A1J1LT57_9CYAN|nr:hypothetical protein PL9214720035 [Planktothrix tepida PCC 9214]